MMKVLWLTNIPSPYRVDFFNELGKSCELTVLFEKKGSEERDSSWLNYRVENFKAVFLKGKSVGVAEAICPSVIQWLRKDYDHIVVTNFSDPTGMMAILWLKLHRKHYELESDGGFPGSGKGLKERIKKFFISGAQRYFSTAELHDRYYLTYGADKERIVRYPFTSVAEKDILHEPLSDDEKKSIREELGMGEKHIALAVGQFIPRKGYDILIRACAGLQNVGVYIVGGKPPEEYIHLVREVGADNVHFVNFKKKKELERYYLAADIFVHPTREDIWGLVINEAMAKGLPVVTTDRCIAGITIVLPGISGEIVSVEDIKQLSEAVESCLQSRKEYSKKALMTIRGYTFKRMAVVHETEWREDKLDG